MYEIRILVGNCQEVEDILEVLSSATEDNILDFSFDVSTREVTNREVLENIGFRLRK